MSFARKNNSTQAIIDNRLYASGTCKNVRRGRYTHGPRVGQMCVAKEFKSGSVFADHYFDVELSILERAQSIIDSWHAALIIDSRIMLNKAEIWATPGGKKVLVEPFINGFCKFNSNTGWAPATGGIWGEAMQALSHFSYHNSGGQFLLCDIQGGGYKDG
ncbi:unnamed protein product [Discula destructiva]